MTTSTFLEVIAWLAISAFLLSYGLPLLIGLTLGLWCLILYLTSEALSFFNWLAKKIKEML